VALRGGRMNSAATKITPIMAAHTWKVGAKLPRRSRIKPPTTGPRAETAPTRQTSEKISRLFFGHSS
jgi:hypothetical protein